MKAYQTSQNNEFIQEIIKQPPTFKYELLSVINDAFEAINVKGSVNRNRRLIQSLICNSNLSDKYS